MAVQPITVPFVSFRPMERELDADLRAAFARVLDNSWYIEGKEDAAFEAAFADYCGAKYCVGCGNGLDALVLILKALGIGPGDEVIVPSNTFIATVLAISYAGATPVFVEPVLASYNIDPASIEAAITEITKSGAGEDEDVLPKFLPFERKYVSVGAVWRHNAPQEATRATVFSSRPHTMRDAVIPLRDP
mgnify:CR=1 FL=1